MCPLKPQLPGQSSGENEVVAGMLKLGGEAVVE